MIKYFNPDRLSHRIHQLNLWRLVCQSRILGDDKRIYHYHVRKTAGTSLNAAFWNFAGLNLQETGRHIEICRNGLVFAHNDRELINQGRYFLQGPISLPICFAFPTKRLPSRFSEIPLRG